MGITTMTDDWLKPPDSDIPLVYGPASTTLGYYELEEASRGNAHNTLSNHQRESILWYRGLTLHLEAQRGRWDPLPGDGTKKVRIARTAQIDLLALSLCSSKAALDMILAGYYSIGWAAIRHCIEVALHCQYLDDFPETYRLWYARDDEDGEDPPRCGQMVDQIKKKHKNDPSPQVELRAVSLERSYDVWRLMSSGSHPTGEGITQLQDMDEPGPRFYGSNYRYDLTMVSFDNGLFALDTVLVCYYLVRKLDPSWNQAHIQWQSDVYGWREELRKDDRVAHLSTKLTPAAPDPTPH